MDLALLLGQHAAGSGAGALSDENDAGASHQPPHEVLVLGEGHGLGLHKPAPTDLVQNGLRRSWHSLDLGEGSAAHRERQNDHVDHERHEDAHHQPVPQGQSVTEGDSGPQCEARGEHRQHHPSDPRVAPPRDRVGVLDVLKVLSQPALLLRLGGLGTTHGHTIDDVGAPAHMVSPSAWPACVHRESGRLRGTRASPSAGGGEVGVSP